MDYYNSTASPIWFNNLAPLCPSYKWLLDPPMLITLRKRVCLFKSSKVVYFRGHVSLRSTSSQLSQALYQAAYGSLQLIMLIESWGQSTHSQTGKKLCEYT